MEYGFALTALLQTLSTQEFDAVFFEEQGFTETNRFEGDEDANGILV